MPPKQNPRLFRGSLLLLDFAVQRVATNVRIVLHELQAVRSVFDILNGLHAVLFVFGAFQGNYANVTFFLGHLKTSL
jgi:hypothetical protein